ncbi:MAG: PDZ domain-containing protein, partial [Planctomycetota bacterium]
MLPRLISFVPLLVVIAFAFSAAPAVVGQDNAPGPRQPRGDNTPAPGPRQPRQPREPRPPAAKLLPAEWRDALTARCIGPANMSGRITDISVDPTNPNRYWVATAGGGLLYTTTNGIHFDHQFDHEATVSIGAVCCAPSKPDTVWVGTGEANPRNSVSWGNGVYKSEDAGKTWVHKGLPGSFQTGAIVVHPTNPDIVFVGALGRLWGENEERGLYRTKDGGTTWERVLYVDARTGVIDVRMQPGNPDVMLVATWERQRDGFDTNDPAKRWGPGSGLWRSIDGGDHFTKVTAGLPPGELGRIGLDFCEKQPEIVFAVVDTTILGEYPADSPYVGITGQDAEVGAKITSVVEGKAAAKAGIKANDIVISMDGVIVHSYAQFVTHIRSHRAGDTIKLGISRDRESLDVELVLEARPAPGEGQTRRDDSPFAGDLGGQLENLQDQQGPDGATFGGTYKSTDAGLTWTRVNSLNPRPMYFSEIRVAPDDPEMIWVLGVALYRSEDGGKTFKEAKTQ